jgi:hypothetical protein
MSLLPQLFVDFLKSQMSSEDVKVDPNVEAAVIKEATTMQSVIDATKASSIATSVPPSLLSLSSSPTIQPQQSIAARDISGFWTQMAGTSATVATFAGAFTYSSLKDACQQSDDICILMVYAFMILVMSLFCSVSIGVLARPGMTSNSQLDIRFRVYITIAGIGIAIGFILLTVSIGLLYGGHNTKIWIAVGVTMVTISILFIPFPFNLVAPVVKLRSERIMNHNHLMNDHNHPSHQ